MGPPSGWVNDLKVADWTQKPAGSGRDVAGEFKVA